MHTCASLFSLTAVRPPGKPRVLAIVCPKSPATQMQCALFVMKPRMFSSKLLLRNIVPVLSGFHITAGEGASVVIRYAKKNKIKQAAFLSASPEDLGAFLRVASNAHQIAQMHLFTVESLASGQSHDWLLARYAEEEHAIKNVMWIANRLAPTAPAGAAELGSPREALLSAEQAPAHQRDSMARNPVLISFMTGAARTEWIQKQLMHREEEFTELRPVNLKVCSWNVGARQPPPQDELRSWIFGDSAHDVGRCSDSSTPPSPAAPYDPSAAAGSGAGAGVGADAGTSAGEPAQEASATGLGVGESGGMAGGTPWGPTGKAGQGLQGRTAGSGAGRERPRHPPDIIAVGLQEVVKLTANALTVNVHSAESRAWLDALSAALGAPGSLSLSLPLPLSFFLFLSLSPSPSLFFSLSRSLSLSMCVCVVCVCMCVCAPNPKKP